MCVRADVRAEEKIKKTERERIEEQRREKGIQGAVKQLNRRQLKESWREIGTSAGHTTDCKYHITVMRSALYHYVIHRT